MTMKNAISVEELSRRMLSGENLRILDVRTPVEHREVHLAAARLEPLDGLDAEAIREWQGGDGECVILCRSGKRAAVAAERLIGVGMGEVRVLEGGMLAWQAAGLPVMRGREGVSLERQVRIAAGVLVVMGVILGWLVNPLFVLLSGFVGVGLVFAGITDTCALGMMIARMPWNKGVAECASGGGVCAVR